MEDALANIKKRAIGTSTTIRKRRSVAGSASKQPTHISYVSPFDAASARLKSAI